MEVNNPFPPKTGENQIHASVVFNIFKFEIKNVSLDKLRIITYNSCYTPLDVLF